MFSYFLVCDIASHVFAHDQLLSQVRKEEELEAWLIHLSFLDIRLGPYTVRFSIFFHVINTRKNIKMKKNFIILKKIYILENFQDNNFA